MEYIEENIERYIDFIPEEDIDIPENKENDQEFIQHKKIGYMDNYIKEAKKMGYARDVEISTTAVLFGCNIRVYQQEYGKFD